MSTNVEKASEKAPEEHQNDSVYDFLYCDTQRLGSFLAQFDDAGHLQEVIQRDSVTRGAKRGFKINLGGGASVLGTGGTGTVGFERSPSDEGTEAAERKYSPLWVNALTFLDYIEGKGLLRRTIETAGLGSFVLFSGEIVLVDLPMMKEAWENPTVRSFIRRNAMQQAENRANPAKNQNRQQRRQAVKGAEDINSNNMIDDIISLLAILPHTIQSRMFARSGTSTWFTLEEQYIVGKASDLLLKHGSHIQGLWHAVGILDALPSAINPVTEEGVPLVDMLANLFETPVGQMAVRMGPAAREALGRPAAAFGITPLLIFREISTG